MEFKQASEIYSLNKTTYVNLRWIGILGQLITINSVKFIFNFDFDFLSANLIIFIGAISNIFLITNHICILHSSKLLHHYYHVFQKFLKNNQHALYST